MSTAIVSDLHLGSTYGEDLLRDAGIRSVLLEEIASAERVVLLGDAIEMRELPLPGALEAARPFFEDLGETMAGREVVIVPGNHDHRLAEPLLEGLAEAGRPVEIEHLGSAEAAPADRISAWLGNCEVWIGYPGVWLRDDVYATHGHYADCHMRLPRIECLAAATLQRAFGPVPDPAAPEDYERVLRALYGFAFGLAQAGLAQRATRPSERTWRMISGRDRRSRARRIAARAMVDGGIPATVWAINRLLRAEFDPDLSAEGITRSGLDATTELARRLGLDAPYVITGHTHRAGPEAEDPAWPLNDGGALHNTGSWVFASAFHHPGTPPGPYWPGTVTWLGEEGPPTRKRLLADRTREELKAVVTRQATRR